MAISPRCRDHRVSLEAFALPADPHLSDDRKFFCKSQVLPFLSRHLSDIVYCDCERCQSLRHVNGVTSRQMQQTLGVLTSVDHGNGSNFGLILGLLLYLDCSALIFQFVRQRCNDDRLMTAMDNHNFEEFEHSFWPEFRRRSAAESHSIARKLYWRRYNFFIPVLEYGVFSSYDRQVILPFLNEQKLGLPNAKGEIISEGAYGHIYAFEIPEEYHNFEVKRKSRRFVRKELRDNNESGIFKAERSNLDYVKRIKDKHIIFLIKVYEHGGVGNIIFPEAMTNLGHFLRDDRFGAMDLSVLSLEHHPFWTQMIGLARALHKILDYEVEDATRNEVLYGYHFDLKPANILVDYDGTFLISDFGQAHFRKAGASSSKVVGFGGTESYAPPEFDNPRARQNRKYDIWSLGCIFLEIYTFIAAGTQGLQDLDRLRIHASEDSSEIDDRFFLQQKGEYILKPAIESWIQHLAHLADLNSDKTFSQGFFDLIRGMLTVAVHERYSSKEVCYKLSAILNERHFSVSSPIEMESANNRTKESVPAHQGIEIGAEAMAQVRHLKYHLRYWNSGPLRFLRSENSLFLYARENRDWKQIRIGDVRQLKLFPRYALHDSKQHRYTDSSIYLGHDSDEETSPLACDKFWSPSLSDIMLLQEALTGQKVIAHVQATKIVLSLPSSLTRVTHVPMKLLNHKLKGNKTVVIPATIIQIWSATPRLRRGSDGQLLRSTGHMGYVRPLPRRVVAISINHIHILRINDHMCLEHESSSGANIRSLTLISTDKSPAGSFKCLELQRTPAEFHPGIPIGDRALAFQEEYESMAISRFQVEFGSPDAMAEFKNAYRTMKYRWEVEDRAYTKNRNEVGPRLGYARNAR